MPLIILRILLVFLYLAAVFSILYGLWMLIPFFYGLPWVPTETERARKALEMAKLQPDEVLYDLGSGDGRILCLAVEMFDAKAVGIEIGILQYWFTQLKCCLTGKKSRVNVRRENFYRANLSDADLIFAFLTSTETFLLRKKLERELKPGSRVIAVSADFADWKPIAFDDDELLFLYEMPPQKGGLAAYLAERE